MLYVTQDINTTLFALTLSSPWKKKYSDVSTVTSFSQFKKTTQNKTETQNLETIKNNNKNTI